MEKLLYAAGTSFLRAFGAAFLVSVFGILAAPNMGAALALSVAALAAALAAGLRAIQVFIPKLSFATWVRQPVAAWLDAFTRAFLAAFVVAITGWLAAPDLSTWKSVVYGAAVGALTAGFRAIQGLLTAGHSPTPGFGT